MFGIDATLWASAGGAVVLAVVMLAAVARRRPAPRDDTIDWDVGGDIV